MPPLSTPHTTIPAGSAGLVESQIMRFDQPLMLECGRALEQFELIYETYGSLKSDRSNAVLVCHALSSDHHAAGFHSPDDKKPGWWDAMIGPGKAIDTLKFYVVCMNNLGGCSGSTGPTSINPATGKAYGPDFPLVTVKDWVKTQAMLCDRLNLAKLHAVVGGSLGGMQALQWSIDYPDRLERCAVIASTPKLTAQNIAFNEVARQSIISDASFFEGDYLSHGSSPKHGLMLARMIGHLTYLTDEGMRDKFGRDRPSATNYSYDVRNVDFEVESYFRYQGDKFSELFDANSYLIMTKALDYFDPAANHASLSEALSQTQCRFLVISFTSDWRFTPARSRDLTDALIAARKPVSLANVEASQGHDSFLFAIPRYVALLSAFLSSPLLRPEESAHAD